MFTASGVFDGCHRAVGIDMAAACAVTQITDGVCGVRVFVLFMWTGFEITGMTAGTIRLVLWCAPGDRLRISPVALCACKVTAMVAGIAAGCVPEGVRCPAVGVMTGIALQAGDKMIAWFSGCLGTVVAARTGTGNIVVVEAGG